MKKRLPLVFLGVLPLILCIANALVCLYFAGWENEYNERKKLAEWRIQAKNAVGILENNHYYDAQINRMARRMLRSIERLSSSDPTGNFRADWVTNSFKRAFPKSHRPSGTRIWAFAYKNGEVCVLSGSGLESSKSSVFRRIFDAFTRISDEHSHLDGISGKIFKFCIGTFGADMNPRILGRERRGLLTPVFFEGANHYFYWNRVAVRNKIVGGFFIIFPNELPARSRYLVHAADEAYRFFKGKMLPVIVPVIKSSKKFPGYIFPRAINRSDNDGKTIELQLRKALDDPKFLQGDTFRSSGFLFWRDFFSKDEPYEVVLISYDTFKRKNAFSLGNVTLVTLCFFVSLFMIPVLFKSIQIDRSHDTGANSLAGLSMKAYFSSLLILITALPISVFWHLGDINGDLEISSEVEKRESMFRETVSKIESSSNSILDSYSKTLTEIVEHPSWQKLILSKDTANNTKAFSRVLSHAKKKLFPLDAMMILKPGEKTVLYLDESKVHKPIISGRTDFFAALIAEMHLLTSAPDCKKIILNHEQKILAARMKCMFAEKNLASAFRNVYVTGETVRFQQDKMLMIIFSINMKGKPMAYLLFVTEAGNTEANHLKQLSVREMLSEKRFIAFGTISDGAVQPLRPNPENGYWNSHEGILLQKAMNMAEWTAAPLIMNDSGTLYMAKKLEKWDGRYIAETYDMTDLLRINNVRRFLIRFVIGAMMLVVWLLRGMTDEHLLEPLKLIDLALRKVAQGDLEHKLDFCRNDEIGEISKAFNGMTIGLKQRRQLGKFVSGGLLKTVEENDSSKVHPPSVIEGAVLVSDIRSFTTISERYEPTEVVTMLNEHLDRMSDAIQEYGGIIDKFIGDAVIAVFLSQNHENPAASAIKAAVVMMTFHEKLQQQRASDGSFTYKIGIGIDFGEMMGGALQGEGRLEYSFLGTPRNNAEKLEASSKSASFSGIMVSRQVKEMCEKNFRFSAAKNDEIFELIMKDVS